MDHVKVAHELWRRLLEQVPGVHVHVGRQPGLGADLVQADVETMEFDGVGLFAGKIVKPNALFSLLVPAV